MKFAALTLSLAIAATCVPASAADTSKAPNANVPGTYRGLATQETSMAAQPWEKLYTDPVLQALIKQALAKNYTVAQAYQSVIAAQANFGIVRANQQPYVNGALQAPYQITNGDRTGSTPGTAFEPQLGVTVGYQVDLFGRLHAATAGARAQILATASAANVVVATLVSQVATAYFQIRQLDATLDYSLSAAKDDEENLRLIKLRVDYGESSIQDQYQAQQALYQVTQNIPVIRQSILQTENSLSVLIGDYPHDIPRGRPLLDQLALPLLPAAGFPAELLSRRPDIQEAEYTLAAANANVDVARKALYPSLNLSLSAALSGQVVTGLFPQAVAGANGIFYSPISVFSLVPQLVQSIFSGGALQSQVRLAKADQEKLVYAYLGTVQNAVMDVSNAIVAYNQSRLRRNELEKNVDTSQKSLKIANERYEQGETSYLEVLNANTLLYNAQISLEGARLNERLALSQLYLALGGGWGG